MDKKEQEKLNRKKSNEKYNSITQKVKPENQNQSHNVRSEAVEPKIRQMCIRDSYRTESAREK